MARSDAPREKIGHMLVSLGLITKSQLDEALLAQQSSKLPLGKQLVALGAVSETRLTQVLSNQLSVPWVSLERVEFPGDLLGRIPADIADSCSVLPVYLRTVRGKGTTLYVAMDDPTDEESLRKIAEVTTLSVRPMIAPPSEIRRAIEQRYFGVSIAPSAPEENTGLRSIAAQSQSARQQVPSRLPGQSSTKLPPKGKKLPPLPIPAGPRSDVVVSQEHSENPSRPSAAPTRTLTLLDGTQIQVPVGRGGRETNEINSVRQLIHALRSSGVSGDGDEPLKWHDVVQVLLDALSARGVRLTARELSEVWLSGRGKRKHSTAQ
jgi:hypothetical protein